MEQKTSFIFDTVLAQGAKADLIVDQRKSLSLKANEGSLEEHSVSSTHVFGLRVIKDGHVGIAYSEADDQASLLSMTEQALTNASFAKQEEFESILDNSAILRTDDSLLCPQDDTTIDVKIETVLKLEDSLLQRDKIKSVPYNGLSEASIQRQIFSTAGLNTSIKQSYTSLYAYALAEFDGKNAMEGHGQLSRLHKDFNTQEISNIVHQNCLDMLEGSICKSGHYDVIFDNECQIKIFDTFALPLSGKAAKDGINPWREKLDQAVADERLNLSDQPLLLDGFGYELFDAEGTACSTTTIISNGSLQNLLHNSSTAKACGVKTTGHATRGPKSSLSVSSHQLVIDAGSTNISELHSGDYIEITGLSGLHSGANAISGDFSFGASGFLCRDGVRQQVLRGITVAGNFYQMLNRIHCIGDTQHWNWQKSSLMPSIRFAEMSISG